MSGAARTRPATAPAIPGAGLLLAAAIVYVGWVNRDDGLLVAEHGVGYLLGIAGGAMMALIPLYSLRKRSRGMRRAGSVRGWFRAHMAAGVVGPVLILFHCNFDTGSMNSTIALAAMLAVVASGLVGRWLYTGVHNGLYGRRRTLEELRVDSDVTAARIEPLLMALPALRCRLGELADVVSERPRGLIQAAIRVAALAVRTRIMLAGAAFALIDARARVAAGVLPIPVGAIGIPSVGRSLVAVGDHLEAVRRVAAFGLYERLFALWHLFHVPLFVMLVVSSAVHVVAVHLY